MFKLFKNMEVYTPKYIGTKDILICNDRIIDIDSNIEFFHKDMEVLDRKGKICIPGIIDQHIHITGGGGEGSFETKVPEVALSELVNGGVTTVVGLLGTDAMTRSVENLLAKARALQAEGVVVYCLTGSYEFPSPTLMGSVKKDIVFIPEILGVKLALSDHRSSNVTKDELKRLASDVRVGGMLSGKSSYIKLHMGNGLERFALINQVLKETSIPITHFRPTHVGRTKELFEDAMEFAKRGGIIDITANDSSNVLPLQDLFKQLKENKIPLENVTISSDGKGSWSTYDEMGKLDRIGYARCDTIYTAIKKLIEEKILLPEEGISLGTRNVSEALGLDNRGTLSSGRYADILILDEDFQLNDVLANGKFLMRNRENIVKGIYE